jgi:hypothetical protein
MKTFGMSAPIKVVSEHFCFVAEHVVAAAKEVHSGIRKKLGPVNLMWDSAGGYLCARQGGSAPKAIPWARFLQSPTSPRYATVHGTFAGTTTEYGENIPIPSSSFIYANPLQFMFYYETSLSPAYIDWVNVKVTGDPVLEPHSAPSKGMSLIVLAGLKTKVTFPELVHPALLSYRRTYDPSRSARAGNFCQAHGIFQVPLLTQRVPPAFHDVSVSCRDLSFRIPAPIN